MESTRFIQDEIEAELAKAEAISDLAEEENRDLNPTEQKSWDKIMHKKTGTVKKLKDNLAAAEAEKEKMANAAIAQMQSKRRGSLAYEGQSVANMHSDRPMIGAGLMASADSPEKLFPGMNMNDTAPQTEDRLISRPLRAFQNQRDAFDSGMSLRAFLARSQNGVDEAAEQHIAARGWSIRATQTEGTPTAGGYTVPTPMSNAIVNVRQQAGVSRVLSRVMPMTSDTLDVPKKTASCSVYYPGEANAITASDQTFESVNLNAKKRAVLSYVSQELNDDSIIPFMDDLASEIGLDLAIQEDNEWLNGDGTSTYGNVNGLKNAIGTAGVLTADTTSGDTWEELTLQNFTDCMALLDGKYWPRGVAWCCSAQFYYSVMLNLMVDAGGNAISDIEMGQRVGRPLFLGAPVYFSSQMPKATAVSTIACYFGSFSDGILIGDRLGVRIAQSDQYAFNTDRLAIRATSRYDIVAHDVGDSSNPGAVVALSTGAAS